MTSIMPIIRTKKARPIARKFEASRTTTIIEKTSRKRPVPMLKSLLCEAFGSIDKDVKGLIRAIAEMMS